MIICLVSTDLNFQGNERKVKLFDMMDWSATAAVPASKKSLVELIELVESWKSTRGKGPIIVVCMYVLLNCTIKLQYCNHKKIYRSMLKSQSKTKS